jgi:hypothetical protein
MQSGVVERRMSHWPEMNVERDHETLAILHLASQMLGKIRVAHAPWSNHGWHAALQPVANGFATLPTAASDGRAFTLILDLCEHVIVLRVSDGSTDRVPLDSGSIAALHSDFVQMLDRQGLPSTFDGMPNEIEGAAPFAEDKSPRTYSRDSAKRLRGAFAAMIPVFDQYRAGFIGKSSPTHFWWGSFDLAVSRFSGRQAPPHPGGVPGLPDRVAREAYSHEVISGGFWAGGATAAAPFFYGYIYPEADGYRGANVEHGHFDETFGEFILPYADVRSSPDPDRTLMEFLQSNYEIAANLANWDRAALERDPVAP